MQETFNIENLKGRCRENLPLSSRDQIELMWSLREPYRWLHGIREVDEQITFDRSTPKSGFTFGGWEKGSRVSCNERFYR